MRVPTGAQDGHGKLDALDPLLDVDGGVVRKRVEDCLAQLLLRLHLVHAQRAAAVGRLDRHGIAAGNTLGHQVERGGRTHFLEGVSGQEHALRPGGDAVLAGQVAVFRQAGMQRILVVRAVADACGRADERNAQELQQALDGAVLAVLSVKRAVHHVGLLAAQRRHQLAVRVERHHLVAGLFQRVAHALSAFQRELALERRATHQNGNFQTHCLSSSVMQDLLMVCRCVGGCMPKANALDAPVTRFCPSDAPAWAPRRA